MKSTSPPRKLWRYEFPLSPYLFLVPASSFPHVIVLCAVSSASSSSPSFFRKYHKLTDQSRQSLSGLIEGGSITLNERGDVEPIPRHPNFRLFACMNPPTDMGKKVRITPSTQIKSTRTHSHHHYITPFALCLCINLSLSGSATWHSKSLHRAVC